MLILPVVLSLGGAALLLMLARVRAAQAPIALLVVAAVAACDLELFRRVMSEGPLAMTMGNWLPPFGISFTADVLGAAFALIASAITFLVLVYAQVEEPGRDGTQGFHAWCCCCSPVCPAAS